MFDERWSKAKYRLEDIKLDEISLVDVPAHPMAKTVIAKADPTGSMVHVPVPLEDRLKRVSGKRDYSADERRRLADEGEAMPDGSFPIPDRPALRDAVRSIGRTNPEKRDRVKRWIIRRAKELNALDLVPEDWRSTTMEKMYGRRSYDKAGGNENPFADLRHQMRSPSQPSLGQSQPPARHQENPFADLKQKMAMPEQPSRSEEEPDSDDEKAPRQRMPSPEKKKEEPDDIRQSFLDRLRRRKESQSG